MDPEYLSIGDVAEDTGLSPDLLRVWERRYGFPVPVRLPSGHRRYPLWDVRRLRLMAAALARGHRASKVARLDEDTLQELLKGETPANEGVEDLLREIEVLNPQAVSEKLRASWHAMGLRPFLKKVVSPLLNRVETLWAEGRLGIHQERLLTEVMEDLLRELHRGYTSRPGAPSVALATLPGEQHRLGLLMAALDYASQGWRVEVLDVDLPVASLAAAVQGFNANILAITISLKGGGELTRQLLRDLRERIPQEVRLGIGGPGAARLRKVEGVERLDEAFQGV